MSVEPIPNKHILYAKMVLSVKVHNEIPMLSVPLSVCTLHRDQMCVVHYFNTESNQCTSIGEKLLVTGLCIAIPMDKQQHTNRDEYEMKQKRNRENELIWPKARKMHIQIRTINDRNRMTPLLSAKRSFLPRSFSFHLLTMYPILDRGVILQNTVTIFVIVATASTSDPIDAFFEFDGDRCELETKRTEIAVYFIFIFIFVSVVKSQQIIVLNI